MVMICRMSKIVGFALVVALGGAAQAAEVKIGVSVPKTGLSTGFNLATAPVFARYGYPQRAVSAITDKIEIMTNLSPVVKAAKAPKPDTFALTKQAMIAGLDVKVYYTAVATAYPAFAKRSAAHQKMIVGKHPDYWASATTYVSLQVLEAIKGVWTAAGSSGNGALMLPDATATMMARLGSNRKVACPPHCGGGGPSPPPPPSPPSP